MVRHTYILSILLLTLFFEALVPLAPAFPILVPILMLVLVVAQLAASMWRWQNIGHNKWWGLLVVIPLVQIYGFAMPRNGKTEGLDRAGMVILAVLVILFALSVAKFGFGIIDV